MKKANVTKVKPVEPVKPVNITGLAQARYYALRELGVDHAKAFAIVISMVVNLVNGEDIK